MPMDEVEDRHKEHENLKANMLTAVEAYRSTTNQLLAKARAAVSLVDETVPYLS